MSEGKGESQHFIELDGMRGVLSTMVMLMHYGMDRVVAIFSGGHLDRCLWDLSVDFFFILSGFVLARSFEKSRPSVSNYFVKRIFRLAPVFLLTLAIMLALGERGDSATLIANVLMIQSLLALPSLNFPSWSIPFEFVLPLFGIALITGWQRWSPLTRYMALTASIIFAALACYMLARGTNLPFLRAGAGLAAGFLLFGAVGQTLRERPGRPLATALLFAAILIVMLVGHQAPAVTLAFPPLVAVTIVIGAPTKGLLSLAPFRALGRWSYSIYLLHIPVLATATRLLGSDVVGHNPTLKIVLAVVTMAVSALCCRFFEMPLARLARRYTQAA